AGGPGGGALALVGLHALAVEDRGLAAVGALGVERDREREREPHHRDRERLPAEPPRPLHQREEPREPLARRAFGAQACHAPRVPRAPALRPTGNARARRAARPDYTLP